MSSKKEPFKYTTCAMCGKRFIKAPENIYHVNFAGRINQCCSYKCYRKALQTKEAYCSKEYRDYMHKQ